MNDSNVNIQGMMADFVGRFADQRLSQAMAAAEEACVAQVSGSGGNNSSVELLRRVQGTQYALSRFVTDI